MCAVPNVEFGREGDRAPEELCRNRVGQWKLARDGAKTSLRGRLPHYGEPLHSEARSECNEDRCFSIQSA